MTPTLDFRPHQGLMKIGEKLAQRFGLAHLWEGDEGIASVLSGVLKSAGVSETAIPLTPRKLAEETGMVKRKRRGKRCP
jgi:hypothetical protein